MEQSRYYSNNEFKTILDRTKSGIQIANLNCGGLPSKFNRFKIFLSSCNDTLSPVSVITLQETHFTHNTDLSFYELPEYTLVSDIARINSFGGVAIYVHNSFSFSRLHTENLHSNSQVYESLFIEIHHNHKRQNKFIIGNVYRRPSELIDNLTLFINDFTETLNYIHRLSKRSYITGDFNIDLLKINRNIYYNNFYESLTGQGFFPMITRPTRLSDDSNTLIDNIFTNNLCKTHTSGILTSPISDHLLNFCILEDTHVCHIKNNMFVEIEKISTTSINNFRNSVIKSEIMSKLDLDPQANANENYKILSKIITESKNKHIPKKI